VIEVESVRERNPRGQGARLRDEIVEAATALLDETGREDSLTLRAVARRANITAPSIYAHFADREAILDAVIEQAFLGLIASVESHTAGIADPVESLHAGCQGYVDFATAQPRHYRVLFNRQPDPDEPRTPVEQLSDLTGERAFGLLVDGIAACVEAGRSGSVDPFADAAVLWSAMHGFAMLYDGLPHFPWPKPDYMLATMIDRIALIHD
jgi:AcrR family transcriptional regulator